MELSSNELGISQYFIDPELGLKGFLKSNFMKNRFQELLDHEEVTMTTEEKGEKEITRLEYKIKLVVSEPVKFTFEIKTDEPEVTPVIAPVPTTEPDPVKEVVPEVEKPVEPPKADEPKKTKGKGKAEVEVEAEKTEEPVVTDETEDKSEETPSEDKE